MSKTTTDAAKIIRQLWPDSIKREASVKRAKQQYNLAEMIYDARKSAGLTQTQLAERIGTRQSAIARLEDADYGQQSLATLFKVAEALGLELEIRMVDGDGSERRADDPPAVLPVSWTTEFGAAFGNTNFVTCASTAPIPPDRSRTTRAGISLPKVAKAC